MITIEKTYGVRNVADERTLVRLQEIIALSKNQWGWVGKAVIDAEKITFYKFGLKLGLSRHAKSGLVVNEYGTIRYVGFDTLEIFNNQVLEDLYRLFGVQRL